MTIERDMNWPYLTIPPVLMLVLALAGCIGQSEQAKQHEAVEYQMEQHDSAKCADAGLLPGSDPFTACMAKLAGAPTHAAP